MAGLFPMVGQKELGHWKPKGQGQISWINPAIRPQPPMHVTGNAFSPDPMGEPSTHPQHYEWERRKKQLHKQVGSLLMKLFYRGGFARTILICSMQSFTDIFQLLQILWLTPSMWQDINFFFADEKVTTYSCLHGVQIRKRGFKIEYK